MVDGQNERALSSNRLLKAVLVLVGILVGQFILYGPALTGRRVLLPLDILAQPDVYIPRTPEITKVVAQNRALTDIIYVFEPSRRFAISELRAGRLPMWAPYEFSGVPFIWPKFSPFLALECLTASPIILAWAQVAAALVAGVGAYLFFRRVLEVGFWPAVIGAWCYPLTGFFIFWQGYPTSLPVCWLPWIFLVVHRVVHKASWLWALALAGVSCLVLVSGFPDIAAQVLLGSGFYALWECAGIWRSAGFKPQMPRILGRLAVGWSLGLLLAMPYLLPVLEYSRTGSRLARRGGGQEERPPMGLAALPQVVLPDMYGSRGKDSTRPTGGHQAESSAAAYAGLLTTLLVAPLAFASSNRRRLNLFLVLLALLGLAWTLNVPGVVQLMRLPGANMMSHNRLVFLSALAILALAVVGLDVLLRGLFVWRWWAWLPGAMLAALCAWCLYRTAHLPEPFRTQLMEVVRQGREYDWIHDAEGVSRVQNNLSQYYARSALWCGIGVLGCIALRMLRLRQSRLVPVLGALLLLDLLWFAHGRNVQSDPALYFPPVPVLQAVAKADAGRIIGYGCLPAPLAAMCGLRDVRGYDAVDPAEMVELVSASADPASVRTGYAATMQVAPQAIIAPAGDIRIHPVLDMLGVRYVILRGSPPTNAAPIFRGPDYWVLQNPEALDRVFVPERIEVISDHTARLQKLASAQFKPREVAYVEIPVNLPAPCRGKASIVEEVPTRIRVSTQMETAGLVVLADRWDKGWKAYLDGKAADILRANNAIRGVIVSAGEHQLVFRYEPGSFYWGLRLAALASVVILIVLAISLAPHFRRQ